jgi:carbon-monoxide dehydrogenase medium subunit
VKPAPFLYVAPRHIDEALAAMLTHGEEAKPLAGGQSLGPLLNMRLASPGVLVDLGRVAGLDAEPTIDDRGVYVPAMVSQRRVETNPLIATRCPVLSEALGYVAHRTIRNRGTVCGSIAHADPAAELPAIAVLANATCHVIGARGRRVVSAREFVRTYFTTAMEPEEILLGVRFAPIPTDSGSAWLEFAPRRGDYAIVGVGAIVELAPTGTVRTLSLAYSGIADTPFRDDRLDSLLVGRRLDDGARKALADLASQLCSPGEDLVGTAKYRRELVRVLTERAIAIACRRAEASR